LTLDRGHIDAFNVSVRDGQAVLQLKEDVTGLHVAHEAESVLMRVKESALVTGIPAGTPGAPAGYVLPLTQSSSLIWPGWDTNGTAASGFSDVSINVTAVDGPGQVFLYTQGSFGDWKPILTSGSFTLPGTIRESTPVHTHAQWIFGAKGIYKLTVNAVAKNPKTGQELATNAHTYVFQVGDVPLGDAFCSVPSPSTASITPTGADASRTAASRAGDPESAEEEAARRREAEAEAQRRAAEADDYLEALASLELHPAAVAGYVGGGFLALSGIGGATWWAVRRVGAAVRL
jgi:surface-anchored protein